MEVAERACSGDSLVGGAIDRYEGVGRFRYSNVFATLEYVFLICF